MGRQAKQIITDEGELLNCLDNNNHNRIVNVGGKQLISIIHRQKNRNNWISLVPIVEKKKPGPKQDETSVINRKIKNIKKKIAKLTDELAKYPADKNNLVVVDDPFYIYQMDRFNEQLKELNDEKEKKIVGELLDQCIVTRY
jgi:hypothetical protein